MKIRKHDIYAFAAAFLLYFALLANSINVFDFFAYESYVTTSTQFDLPNAIKDVFGVWGGGSGGFSRSSFYVLLSYPFAFFLRMFGVSAGFSLNMFSALVVALSVVFVRRSASLLFEERLANFATLVYALLPWMLFNGINATLSSLQLAIVSAWLYYVLRYRLENRPEHAYAASGLLAISVFTHLTSLPLVFPHLYILLKAKWDTGFAAKNLAIMSPAGMAFLYFSVFNKAYSASPSATKFIFSLLLVSWEFVSALSLPVLALSVFSVASYIAGRYKKSAFHDIFLLAFIATIPTMLIFHYVPVANFTPVFVFIPLFIAHAFKPFKKPFLIGLVIVVLLLVKTVPMAYNFHYYPHPHIEYAQWLGTNVGDNYVLVGHECAAARVYIPDKARCENEENSITADKSVLLTSQYIENENQLELGYAAKILGISPANLGIEKPLFLEGKNYTLYASFSGNVRPVEDHYEWLYSVYPNPLYNLFFYGALPAPEYNLYALNR